MAFSAQGQGGLKNGFYSSSCPRAEAIVRSTVESHFNKDPTIAAGLLRLLFHDCFVQGCDGSVLIEGEERKAGPSFGLRGFEVIDDAKTQLETLCPGVVSCADILALAARDAVNLSDIPIWSVPTGRRDGRTSSAFNVSNFPRAHTIGQTACLFFEYRLYNYSGTGKPDPTINPEFLPQLQALCPENGDGSKMVALDKDSQTKFDVSFFKNVKDGNGVLESDQSLWGDAATRTIVNNYAANIIRFDVEFPKAMIKMSSIEVKTGAQGEIRKICSKPN
ncbi:hypothetical protein L1049_001276 [Liquidambar formosana]|uniref:peroxidase n=1 Tax=Liquidambar formosana TaxID=63359 RepID=A0AAP0NC25_LIQFO